jgi:hypothetical protein
VTDHSLDRLGVFLLVAFVSLYVGLAWLYVAVG